MSKIVGNNLTQVKSYVIRIYPVGSNRKSQALLYAGRFKKRLW